MPSDINSHSGNDRRSQAWVSATCSFLPAAQAETADLRRAEQRTDMLLAMLGHELRNPLAGISSAGQLLAHPAVTQEQSLRVAKIVGRQVLHMVHLVNDLLDVSRVSQGQLQIDQEPVDLLDVPAGAREPAHGLGCGATFTLTLPLLQAGVAEATARAEALAAVAPSPSLTIALVDDNADAAKPLAMLLEPSGQHSTRPEPEPGKPLSAAQSSEQGNRDQGVRT
jgi:hypothetical protein